MVTRKLDSQPSIAARPSGARALLVLLVGALVCWIGLRVALPQHSAPPPASVAEPAPAPEPAPVAAPEPVAPMKPAVQASTTPRQTAAARLQAMREATKPAEPPKKQFDPATDPPTISSPDGLRIERTWGNTRELPREFGKHGKEFASRSVFFYAAQAAHFFQEAPKYGFPTKIDDEGVIRIYDPGSNTYGEYNPDGTTRKFMRSPGGYTFFNDQPGTLSQPLGAGP